MPDGSTRLCPGEDDPKPIVYLGHGVYHLRQWRAERLLVVDGLANDTGNPAHAGIDLKMP